MSEHLKLQFDPVRHLCTALQKSKSVTFKGGDLRALGVQVHDLDCENGTPSDSNQQYFRPQPKTDFKKFSAQLESSTDPSDWAFYHRPIPKATKVRWDLDYDESYELVFEADPFDCTINSRQMLEKFVWGEACSEEFIAYNHRL